MTLDTSDFAKGLKKLADQSVPKEVARGLFMAGNELLHDAIYEVKYTAPMKTGDLRGSARTQGGDGSLREQTGGEAPRGFKAYGSTGESSINAGFNIEYAAKWHEVKDTTKITWTRTYSKDPGHKYLENKMRNAKKYMWIVGEHLRRLLGGK
jgi:hypothetical protein